MPLPRAPEPATAARSFLSVGRITWRGPAVCVHGAAAGNPVSRRALPVSRRALSVSRIVNPASCRVSRVAAAPARCLRLLPAGAKRAFSRPFRLFLDYMEDFIRCQVRIFVSSHRIPKGYSNVIFFIIGVSKRDAVFVKRRRLFFYACSGCHVSGSGMMSRAMWAHASASARA